MTKSPRSTNQKTELGEVLVVEDDRDFRDLVVAQLRRAGYHVTGIHDGYAAAEYIGKLELKHQQPAAVISDIHLPGFNGLTLLEAIRGANWTSPVILMTGFGLANTEQAARLDAVAVLSKPFAVSELEGLLDTVVGVPFGVGPKVEVQA